MLLLPVRQLSDKAKRRLQGLVPAPHQRPPSSPSWAAASLKHCWGGFRGDAHWRASLSFVTWQSPCWQPLHNSKRCVDYYFALHWDSFPCYCICRQLVCAGSKHCACVASEGSLGKSPSTLFPPFLISSMIVLLFALFCSVLLCFALLALSFACCMTVPTPAKSCQTMMCRLDRFPQGLGPGAPPMASQQEELEALVYQRFSMLHHIAGRTCYACVLRVCAMRVCYACAARRAHGIFLAILCVRCSAVAPPFFTRAFQCTCSV